MWGGLYARHSRLALAGIKPAPQPQMLVALNATRQA